MVWDRKALPLCPREFRDVHVQPEPDFPFGRKGRALAGAWKQLGKDAAGMLILDGDVAVDPRDFAGMMQSVGCDLGVVHTAPARLWPATRGEDWRWAHWTDEPSQVLEEEASSFSFCFTYLPKRLLDACVHRGLAGWQFPHVDVNVSAVARDLGIPVRVATGCRVVHMHY